MDESHTDKQRKMNILAVDDEETILKLYTVILGQMGHAIVKTKTGKEALQLIHEQSFDLVFLDLKLPDMHGSDLLKEIRHRFEWIPVVIVTANPSLESSIEAINLGGVYEYIIKPFGPEDLKMCIQRAAEKAELYIQNKRLVQKVENANKVLMERVEDLENFAKLTTDYEKKIGDMKKYINDLEAKIHMKDKKTGDN